MAVVDVYDALSTDRPYRGKLSAAESLRVLRGETERGAWDPRVATAFIDLVAGAPHWSEIGGGAG
jgi:HD-GYP domain-containing protein (c-di-GMP phosphodiesterase class II)